MTEKQLKSLGFKKVEQSGEHWNDSTPFYYYTLDINERLYFISSANDEGEGYSVFFGETEEIEFTEFGHLASFISLLRAAVKD